MTISAQSVFDLFAPYFQILALAFATAVLTWAANAFTKRTGIQISQSAIDQISALAKSEAGALVAKASDNLTTKSFTIGDPVIVNIANKLIANFPDLMKKAGLAPADIQTLVLGHIGSLQATMTVANTPASAGESKTATAGGAKS